MDSSQVVLLVVVGVVVVATLGVAIFFFARLLRMGRLVRADAMPRQGKFAFWAAIVYGISPIDVLPDPIFLDDIGVVLGAITYLTHLARKHGLLGSAKTVGQLDAPPSRRR